MTSASPSQMTARNMNSFTLEQNPISANIVKSALTLPQFIKTMKVQKAYQCKYCDKCFRLPSYCMRHEVIHAEVKSHQCKHCDKRFYWSKECKQHELSHRGVKPYNCQFCDNCFRRSPDRKCHELTHTGIKPHKCKYCNMYFTRRPSCEKHELKHRHETVSDVKVLS